METIEMSVTFSGKGKFFIGDPCYAMADDAYDVFLTEYSAENCAGTLSCENFDGSFAIARTAHGVGLYKGKTGKKYPVYAGIIGIVEESLWEETTEEYEMHLNSIGTVVAVNSYIRFHWIGGTFKIETDSKTNFNEFIDTDND